MVKKYENFLKEGRKLETYKFGCVLLELEIPQWNDIISKIDKQDVYEPSPSYGIETDPHLTILYGLHSDIDESKVVEIINKYKYSDFHINTLGISNFKNPGFDVVKIEVEKNDILQSFHEELSELPNSNEFPEYKPHITIAFVNSGTSTKYLDSNFKLENLKISMIEYSKPDGQKSHFNVY